MGVPKSWHTDFEVIAGSCQFYRLRSWIISFLLTHIWRQRCLLHSFCSTAIWSCAYYQHAVQQLADHNSKSSFLILIYLALPNHVSWQPHNTIPLCPICATECQLGRPCLRPVHKWMLHPQQQHYRTNGNQRCWYRSHAAHQAQQAQHHSGSSSCADVQPHKQTSGIVLPWHDLGLTQCFSIVPSQP